MGVKKKGLPSKRDRRPRGDRCTSHPSFTGLYGRRVPLKLLTGTSEIFMRSRVGGVHLIKCPGTSCGRGSQGVALVDVNGFTNLPITS